VDWTVVAVFTGIGVVGSFLGNRLGARVQQDLLKRTFAVFLVVVGVFILWQNAAKIV
jgi:uncharacterized membrane protein YfcA